MAQIITQDGVRIVNGISQSFRPAPSRRPPPTTEEPRERCPHEDRIEQDHQAFLRLARAL